MVELLYDIDLVHSTLLIILAVSKGNRLYCIDLAIKQRLALPHNPERAFTYYLDHFKVLSRSVFNLL